MKIYVFFLSFCPLYKAVYILPSGTLWCPVVSTFVRDSNFKTENGTRRTRMDKRLSRKSDSPRSRLEWTHRHNAAQKSEVTTT